MMKNPSSFMSKNAGVGLCLLLAAACGRRGPNVRSYKEIDLQAAAAPAQSAPMASGNGMMGRSVPTAGLRLAWDTPEGWSQKSSGSMRLATFVMEGAECSVSAFPGNTGGVEANLRRWLGQLDAEATDEQVAGLVQHATAFTAKGGWAGQSFDITSALPDGAAKGMRAAIIPVDGQSVFVKLMGSAEVLEKQRAAFESLCQSLRPAAGAPEAEESPVAAPPAPPAGSMAGAKAGKMPTAGLKLAWKTPTSWMEKAGGSMRLATFVVDGAECSLSAFPGNTGGEAANLKRWLGQLQVEPSAAQMASLSAGAVVFKTESGWDGKLFDLTAALPAGATSGMRAAIIPVDGQTVFVKLNGPVAVLAQQSTALESFCRSLQLKQ